MLSGVGGGGGEWGGGDGGWAVVRGVGGVEPRVQRFGVYFRGLND